MRKKVRTVRKVCFPWLTPSGHSLSLTILNLQIVKLTHPRIYSYNVCVTFLVGVNFNIKGGEHSLSHTNSSYLIFYKSLAFIVTSHVLTLKLISVTLLCNYPTSLLIDSAQAHPWPRFLLYRTMLKARGS